MPRNANGIYTLPPLNPVVPFTTITTQWANTTLPDIGAALSNSIAADGVTQITANLPMGGFRHTSVGGALAASQYAQAGQSQGFVYNIATNVVATNGNTEYDAVVPFGIGSTAAIPTYMPLLFVPPVNNAGPCVLSLNGGAAYPILNADNTVLQANTFKGGRIYFLCANASNWILVTNTLDITILNTQYVRLAGSTMTGALLLSQDPTDMMGAATKEYVDNAVVAGVSGVASFNTRTGAITLLSVDVTTALGYTPLNSAGGTMTGDLTVNSNILLGGVVSARAHKTNISYVVAPGPATLDFNVAQTWRLSSSAGVITLTILSIPDGNMMRLILTNTDVVSFVWPPEVIWPGPIYLPPDFAAGPIKRAAVVLCFDGGNLMANASVY